MNNDVHPILKGLIPLVDGLADTFGKNCEVVLHDI
jgi:predicted transcriptional regulator YheO